MKLESLSIQDRLVIIVEKRLSGVAGLKYIRLYGKSGMKTVPSRSTLGLTHLRAIKPTVYRRQKTIFSSASGSTDRTGIAWENLGCGTSSEGEVSYWRISLWHDQAAPILP
jgi:hypothetical protein